MKKKLPSSTLDRKRQEGESPSFSARLLIQATLPHRKLSVSEHVRKNGDLTVRMIAPSSVGLPYGTYPRCMLHWITSQAVKTRSRVLFLGNLCCFMRDDLGLSPTGGKNGSITRLREHMQRLFSCSMSWTNTEHGWHHRNVVPVEEAQLWWDPKDPAELVNWESSIVLSQAFYDEIVKHRVTLSARVLRALAKDRLSLAMDVYSWLSYRMSRLKKPEQISWPSLALQFGAYYGRTRDFQAAFTEALAHVKTFYPWASVSPTSRGLRLYPSCPHVLPRPYRP